MLHNKLERWRNEVRGSHSCESYGHASCNDTSMSTELDGKSNRDRSLRTDDTITSVVCESQE
jgi:hypothetical protein